MRKITRLNKAWYRNWDFYTHKGVYFRIGLPIKKMPTLRQVMKMLRRESLGKF